LTENSNKDDDLTIAAFSIPLPDDASCPPMDVNVYIVKPGISLMRDGTALPVVVHRDQGLKIFIDPSHPFFTEYQMRPEHVISMEAARLLQDANARFMGGERAHLWSLPALSWRISSIYWRDRLSVNPDRTRKRAEEFFEKIRENLPELMTGAAEEFYRLLTAPDQGSLVRTMVQNGIDASQLPDLIKCGKYLMFLDDRLVASVVEKFPERFFDGAFWMDSYNKLPVDDPVTVNQIRGVVLARYRNLLDDVVGFLDSRQSDPGYVVRVERTLHLLFRNLRPGL